MYARRRVWRGEEPVECGHTLQSSPRNGPWWQHQFQAGAEDDVDKIVRERILRWQQHPSPQWMMEVEVADENVFTAGLQGLWKLSGDARLPAGGEPRWWVVTVVDVQRSISRVQREGQKVGGVLLHLPFVRVQHLADVQAHPGVGPQRLDEVMVRRSHGG